MNMQQNTYNQVYVLYKHVLRSQLFCMPINTHVETLTSLIPQCKQNKKNYIREDFCYFIFFFVVGLYIF